MSNLVALSPAGASGGAGQKGPIRVDGLVFRDETGAIWPYRGITAFLLYQIWLDQGPSAVGALLSNWLAACPGVPFNIVRVLGMVNSFSHWWPQEHPNYYTQLRPFADYLLHTFGLRMEFVIFADSGDIMPDQQAQDIHAGRVVDTLAACENVFIEVANEPSQHVNLPGGDARAYQLYTQLRGRGLLVATGAGDGHNAGDYVTVHTPRDGEWPRKAKDLLDVRTICGRPSVGDEPMGAAEVFIDGKRDTNPRNFADYAVVAQQQGAGSTFHFDAGIYGQMIGPVQASCLLAFMRAAWWMPPEAQVPIFARGEQQDPPGCHWTHAPGDAESPCHHDDNLETRSYGKILEPSYWVVQVQTQRAQPTPCPGWDVDAAGPSVGLTRFRRA